MKLRPALFLTAALVGVLALLLTLEGRRGSGTVEELEPELRSGSSQSDLPVQGVPDDAPSTTQTSRTEAAPAEDEPARPGLAIRGLVQTTDGRRLPGVRVSLDGSTGPESVTDAEGHFRLDGLLSGTHSLRWTSEGLAAIPAPPVRLLDSDRAGVVLLMEAGLGVMGVVRDEAGTGLEGVEVSALLRSSRSAPRFESSGAPRASWTTQTDDAGTFALTSLPAGQVELRVEHRGYSRHGRVISTGSAPLEIVLRPTSAVFGRVLSSIDETPLHVSRVYALVPTRDAEGPWKVMDDPSGGAMGPWDEIGAFRIHPRTRRPIRVVVEGPDFVRVHSELLRLDGTTDAGPLTLLGKEGKRVEGTVLDSEGGGIAGARLSVIEPTRPEGLVQTGPPIRSLPVTSDASGRFRTAPAADGPLILGVEADGYLASQVSLATEEREVTLTLERAGSLRVTLAGDALSWPGAVLRLRPPSGAAVPTPIPTIDRVATFSELQPGSYAVEFVARDARGRLGTVPLERVATTVTAGETAEVILSLPGTARISGTVRIDGAAAPLCEVLLSSVEGALETRCTTDSEGRYGFGGVPPARYALTVRTDPALEPWGRRELDLFANEDASLDFDLRTGALAGMVSAAETELPLAGVRIRLRTADSARTLLAELATDQDGVWQHEGLPIGPVTIEAEKRFHSGRSVVCTVVAGDSLAPAISMRPAGHLEVLVRTKEASPRAELEILAREANDADVLVRAKRTGPGAIDLGWLPQGLYDVELRTADGELTSESTVSVREGHMETLVLDL